MQTILFWLALVVVLWFVTPDVETFGWAVAITAVLAILAPTALFAILCVAVCYVVVIVPAALAAGWGNGQPPPCGE